MSKNTDKNIFELPPILLLLSMTLPLIVLLAILTSYYFKYDGIDLAFFDKVDKAVVYEFYSSGIKNIIGKALLWSFVILIINSAFVYSLHKYKKAN